MSCHRHDAFPVTAFGSEGTCKGDCHPLTLSLSKGRSWFDKLTTNGWALHERLELPGAVGIAVLGAHPYHSLLSSAYTWSGSL